MNPSLEVVDGPGCAWLARVVRQCLRQGHRVEIDGLGAFVPHGRRRFRFEARCTPQVFLAYVQEDARSAARLDAGLRAAGFDPWMDRRKLLAGQNWPRAIEEAIASSDYFVACFSRNAENKRGGFQAEIRYALDCARRMPLDEVFLVPVRLDACRVPRAICSEIHYIDLFPCWRAGLRRLIAALRRGRRAAASPRARSRARC